MTTIPDIDIRYYRGAARGPATGLGSQVQKQQPCLAVTAEAGHARRPRQKHPAENTEAREYF